jgi:DNA-binding response OmpR family regulator
MAPRVLILNNNPGLLELFCSILEQESYEVSVSLTFFEHLAAIEQLCPDLIILDLLLGKEWAGLHMLLLLKTYQPTASIPIIVCIPAESEVHKYRDFLRPHGIPVVLKPFDPDDFIRQVHHTLQSSPSRAVRAW